MPHDPKLIQEAQQHHSMGINELTQILPSILEAIIERQAWEGRERKDGKPFASFYEFTKAPLWHGLGMTGKGRSLSYEDAIRYCEVQRKDVAKLLRAEVPALGKQGGTGANQHTESKPSDRRSAAYGETATYLVRRLKRDHPDIAEALANGEYPSARQAAIAAGIVKVPTPLEAAQKAYLKLSAIERQEFLSWVNS